MKHARAIEFGEYFSYVILTVTIYEEIQMYSFFLKEI